MTSSPRILMASMSDPATATNGSATVTRHLIRLLELAPLEAHVAVMATDLPTSRMRHRLRQAGAVARSLLHALPAKAAFTYSRQFRDAVLQRLETESFDLIILNGGDLLWMAPLLPPAMPRLLVAHNLEHMVVSAQGSVAAPRFLSAAGFWHRESERMQQMEWSSMPVMNNVLFLSTADAEAAADHAPHRMVLPPVFFDPPARDAPGESPHKGSAMIEAAFLANRFWWPNERGLDWFLTQVFPHVRDRVRLHLFGPGTGEVASDDPHIVHHGVVPDLDPVWDCDLMLCPLLEGSGVSVKTAEALYHGVPMLTTRVGIRGLPLPPDAAITIRDDASSWCDYLRETEPDYLRTLRVSPAVSTHFAASSHRSALHRFVESSIAGDLATGVSY